MNAQESVRLRAAQAQLLLYSMGYRSIYGFSQPPPDRQTALQLFAELVRQEVLVPQNGALALQEPWRSCLLHWGNARTVLRLHAGDHLPDCCCYPFAQGVTVCALHPRTPGLLRLTELPAEGLWPWLREQYRLPGEEEGALQWERQLEQTSPEPSEGTPLFLLEYRTLADGAAARLTAVQHPLYRELRLEEQGKTRRAAYREETLTRWMDRHLWPKEETT